MFVVIDILFVVGLICLIARQRPAKGFDSLKKILTKEQIAKIKAFEYEQRVRSWQKKGLISKEQAETILNPTPHKKWSFIASIFYLAVGCIIVGIIALVAANYDKIPPMVRLTNMMIALTGTSIYCWYSYLKGKKIALEASILACFGLVGATIALIAQTYHLSGHTPNAIFLWALLSLPYILLSQKNWWACAWYPFAFFSCAFSTYGIKIWDFLERAHFCPISLALLTISMGLFLKKHAPKHLMTEAFQLWAKIACVFLWMLFDVSLTYGGFSIVSFQSMAGATSGLCILVLTALYPLMCFKESRRMTGAIVISVLLAGITLFVKIPVLGMAFTLFILSALAAYCAQQNQLKAFNLVVLLFFGRVLYAYFHLFGSLAATGTGILILGIFILLALKLWLKYKENIVLFLKNIR